MLFPSLFVLNMAKDTPNHILDNMIGWAQTPNKIHEGGYIPIFLSVLITPTKYDLVLNQQPLSKLGSRCPLKPLEI